MMKTLDQQISYRIKTMTYVAYMLKIILLRGTGENHKF